MKPNKLLIAGLCLGLAVLTIGWTQIIQSITGSYGHTITDGESGWTITGTTAGTCLRGDTLIALRRLKGDSTYVVIGPGGKRTTGGYPLWWNPVPLKIGWSNLATKTGGRTCNNIILSGAYSQLTDDGYGENNIVIESPKIYLEALAWYNQGLDKPGEVEISVGPPTKTYTFQVSGLSGPGFTTGGNVYAYGSITAEAGATIYGTTILEGPVRYSYCSFPVGGIDEAYPRLVQYTYDGNWENIIDSTYYGKNCWADTGSFQTLRAAKDTTLEVALFTRTCTRDTLTYMTGADSLTAAYIVNAFATRGAITCQPYIAGVVEGKLVVDRPAADTASYDRYSVTKILQR